MDIIFPEYQNPIIARAISKYNSTHPKSHINPIKVDGLESALRLLKNSQNTALITGIDYTTRDVALACKHLVSTQDDSKMFSSCLVLHNDTPNHGLPKTIIIADAGISKNPSVDQLETIVVQTYKTATKVLLGTPRIAMLSFSSFGSAKDSSIDKIQAVITKIKSTHPEILIDGEMQLDCAVDPKIADKKAPKNSPVAGHANVLITPDLNSGNLLYKSLEKFGGYTAAGPILQGFKKPISDLSRGSTIEDIVLTIETIVKVAEP